MLNGRLLVRSAILLYIRNGIEANIDYSMQHSKTLVLGFFVLGAISLVNCSPKAGKTVGGSTSSTTNPHLSPAQLADGQIIYTNNCGKCHKLFVPSSKSVETWERVLPSMIRKAKLTDEQGTLVRGYVMANLSK